MSHNNIPDTEDQNQELLSILWAIVKIKGDGKCYCSCSEHRVFKMRRINIETTKTHSWKHGHVEGGHEYFPLASFALYMTLY